MISLEQKFDSFDEDISNIKITKQKLGFMFENNIHEFISQTKYTILREKEIVNKYSCLAYGIDHLMYLEECIICIQDKWRSSKPSLSDINHFISAVKYINDNEFKKCVGIYLSKEPLTAYASKAFEYENNKKINYFFSVYDNDMDKIIHKITKIFYENKIFLYENDGSAIMLYS